MDSEFAQLLQIEGQPECLGKKDPKTCDARIYVKTYLFPLLLPALNEMLTAARKELVLERRRTKFNACDFLTEYLYNKNPRRRSEEDTILWEIPFVQEILLRKPRPPLPLSLVWSDEEAALVIQSFWRGHLVRRDAEVQDLRQYQKEMRENSYHIMFRVEDFWKKTNIEDVEEGQQGEESPEEKLL